MNSYKTSLTEKLKLILKSTWNTWNTKIKMLNYIKREKILEFLWYTKYISFLYSYSFVYLNAFNKKLRRKIPIFYALYIFE